MLGLSLYQPYASLIAARVKRTAARRHDHDYRGWVVVHACAHAPRAADYPRRTVALKMAAYLPAPPLPTQAILATARLVEILPSMLMRARVPDDDPRRRAHVLDPVEYGIGDLWDAPWAWLLEDIRPLATPIPCAGRGSQGLWRPTEPVVAALKRHGAWRA